MQSFCCDVKDCIKKPTSFCKQCIPMRILCLDHSNELHVDGGFVHDKMEIKDKCSFISCTLPILFFCKTHHHMGLCKKHNDLLHPDEHKCVITVPKLVTCTDCSIPCSTCNDTFVELSKEQIVYTCNQCNGRAGKDCTLCNQWGYTCKQNLYGPNIDITCCACYGRKRIFCGKCIYSGEIISKPICSCIKTYATKGCPTCGKIKYSHEWTKYENLHVKS
ncbi:MAG: hypothetical protein Edafosvirus4_54 [Edafosvirus sp.]|uniref:Uncharacterized protein n=1 Tax=Edafosvirus sp. TaxID=2487765 RepID=A0A3G4ZT44_9VIRU|nr:MAG: hypothetical protein Edafosvirus4_54 [Edafosvirus sp.]